jgi:hypothetical protein
MPANSFGSLNGLRQKRGHSAKREPAQKKTGAAQAARRRLMSFKF